MNKKKYIKIINVFKLGWIEILLSYNKNDTYKHFLILKYLFI